MDKLTPAQARNVIHNLRRLQAGYGAPDQLCTDLVGAEASSRLRLIINRLADGNDTFVTLLNSEYPATLSILHHLSIVGVRVISQQTMTHYCIERERLFEQIRVLWAVPYAWATQLIVKQLIPQSGYSSYLLSAQWKLTREATLRRDERRCVECGRTHRLQVHHRTYEGLGDECLDDLVTLCPKCHSLQHPDRIARLAAGEMHHAPTH